MTVKCEGVIFREIPSGGRVLENRGNDCHWPEKDVKKLKKHKDPKNDKVAMQIMSNATNDEIQIQIRANLLTSDLLNRVKVRVKSRDHSFDGYLYKGTSYDGIRPARIISITPKSLFPTACIRKINTFFKGYDDIRYNGPAVGSWIIGLNDGGQGEKQFKDACAQKRKIQLFATHIILKESKKRISTLLLVECKLQHRKGLMNHVKCAPT